MGSTPGSIIALYQHRLAQKQERLAQMSAIREVYENRTKIDLPDTEEFDRTASVPNLLAQGLDQLAGRIASVTPSVAFASASPGVRRHDREALAAAQAVQGWWQMDRLPIKMRQRARHLVGYAETPVSLHWVREDQRPSWHVRDPMSAFPSPLHIGSNTPDDCVFAYVRTGGELRQMGYGDHVDSLAPMSQRDTRFTVLEYQDREECHLVLTALVPTNRQNSTVYVGSHERGGITMERWQHGLGVTATSVPTRIGLSGAMGQFDQMLGMYAQMATLSALEQIAIERGIFPDTYMVGRPNETPQFIDGPHDGRTGKVNVVTGAEIITTNEQPGYMTGQTIDRLERAQRVTSGIPSEFGGESGSNIRTGRRGDAVLSAVVDFPVAEAQEIFATALADENRIAIKMAKARAGEGTKTIYVGTGNTQKPVTYTPNKTFAVEEHVVAYPAVGADMNSLMIGMGQRVGMGTMSKETAAGLDPLIGDVEMERDRIKAEGLEQALMAGLQQQAASGQLPPLVLSQIMRLVKNDRMELPEAIEKALTDAQKAAEKEAQKQAEQQGPQGPMDPSALAAPAAEMALAGGQSPMPGASAGQESLSGLLSALRTPVMAVSDRTGQAGRV